MAAVPPDVRKAFGLPASNKDYSGLRPIYRGAAPVEKSEDLTEGQRPSAHQMAKPLGYPIKSS